MKKIYTLVLFSALIGGSAVGQITSPAPYCSAAFDDSFSGMNVQDAINKVTFGTLNNITNAQYAFPHYVFYNNLAAPAVAKGASIPLTVVFDVHGGCGYGVWIDYNHNNSFEASEKVSGTTTDANLGISSNTTINQNIVIPATAMTGITRMRVRLVEDDFYAFGSGNGFSTSPCNASANPMDVMDWGETEDYNINITGALGVNDVAAVSKIRVYPNPATTLVKIENNFTGDLTYEIFNLGAVKIHNGRINADNQINISSLPAGLYMLRIFENGDPVGVQKLVKQN